MQESLVRTVDNFLTNSQTNFIKNEVHSLRKYWKNFTEYDRWKNFTPTDNQKIQHVLGDAIYLIHTKDTGPVTHEIDRVLQGKLRARFDWLYQLLFITINKQFGLVVEFDYNLTIPAFHVFGGEEMNMPEWNIHTDMGILDYYPDISPGKVVSFVSIIESPKTPAFLDIVIDDDLWKHKEQIEYNPGSIYFWNGILPHRIGKFSLGENEYRITFQGHFYVPYDGLARVYF
jgi:hypothetical protein